MKRLTSLVMALIASVSMFAQQQEVGSLTFNGLVGAGYGTLSEVKSELDNGLMYSVGVNAKYQAAGNLYLTGGLDYRGFKGDEYKESIGEYSKKEALNFGYIDVPVLAHYTFGSHFGVFAGLQPGFLISAKNDDKNFKDECESFNFSIPIGIEWTFNSPMTLSAKYVIPCTKWYDNVYESKMRYFMLTFGSSF